MPLYFAILLAALASTSNHVITAPSVENPGVLDAKRKCINATNEYADKNALLRSNPPKPEKLTELPPADTYAAVYRLENGCAIPVFYRDTREIRPPKR